MRSSNQNGLHASTLGLILAALVLPWIPAAAEQAVRMTVLQTILPAQRVTFWLARHVQESAASVLQLDALPQREKKLRTQLAAARQHARQLEIELLLTRESPTDAKSGSVALDARSQHGDPLIIPELLTAAVIGRSSSAGSLRRILLRRGTSRNVDREMLVLESGLALIDQGRPAGMDVGQPVYSGAAVVGRVAEVGDYVSAIRTITDREFKAHVQLVRQTTQGLRFGSEGRLVGLGSDRCRVHEIPPTEAVAVGDMVFSGERSGSLPFPMLYGRVVRAELQKGAHEWLIEVEPAADLNNQQHVVILREALNPVRMLAN